MKASGLTFKQVDKVVDFNDNLLDVATWSALKGTFVLALIATAEFTMIVVIQSLLPDPLLPTSFIFSVMMRGSFIPPEY